MVRVVPSSSSIVLRASHILLVRLDSAETGPWEQQPSGPAARAAKLVFTLGTVFKGALRDRPGAKIAATVRQLDRRSRIVLPPIDCWSDQPLTSGLPLLVFSRASADTAGEVLSSPKCEKVLPAGEYLTDVRLAIAAETNGWNLSRLLEEATPPASKLNNVFAAYVAARLDELGLEQPANFEQTMRFLEMPQLSYTTRSMLLEEVTTHTTMSNTASDQELNRLAITMFRLLAVPQAAELHDNLVEVDLPNLLGMVGGGKKKSAAQVFQGYLSDRQAAERALANYQGPAPKEPLLAWLKGVQQSGAPPR